ncbi:MAG: DUF5723 family protein [Bacteroidota bacterium]
MRFPFKYRVVAVALAFGLIATKPLLAGDRSNIRGVGMGRTYVASSRNVDALGINPANLGLEDRLPGTILPFAFGIRIGSEFLSYDLYQTYFTGVPDPAHPGTRIAKQLTNADKDQLLSSFPDIGSFLSTDVEVGLVGFSMQLGKLGSIGFLMTEHIGARFDMPKDYFKIMTFGLDSAGSNYNLSGTSPSSWWWREYNISYAKRLPVDLGFVKDLFVGIGVKFVRGYGIVQTEHYTSSFGNVPLGNGQYKLVGNFDFLARRSGADFLDKNTNADFSPFPEPAGKGTGFDIGASSLVIFGLRVGVSVTDIGSISWDKNVVETEGVGGLVITDPFSQAGTDSLKDAIKGKERPGASFTTSLPTKLRIGAMVESEKLPLLSFLPGKMLIALDYNQGLNESMGNTTKPRISLGAEYRIIPLIPLRTGISMGGGDSFRWALGFGLDFYAVSFDLATENFGMLFSPKSFNMFSLATSLRIRF